MPKRSDYDLWKLPNGSIKTYPLPNAERLVVRAVTPKQAYWAAANLRHFDEARQIGPIAVEPPRPAEPAHAKRDDEAVLFAVLNVLHGAPEGPVPFAAIRDWCETWNRSLDDPAIVAALQRLWTYGFLVYTLGRGTSATIHIVHRDLQQLAEMREARTAVLRARDAIQ